MRVSGSFKFVMLIAISLGVFFRLFNIDGKSYWFDETFTSLRISGFTDSEAVRRFSGVDDFVRSGELRAFQSWQPSRTVIDTISGLATEEPQNPPLYYLAAKLWAEEAGNSVFSTRLLAAIFSLLSLPLAYWLCLELFGSPVVGWVAVAIMALSPFYVLLAQTARPQSLWTAVTLFTSAALLRAMRSKRYGFWIAYGFGAVASLYTFVLSALFLLGFSLYVLMQEGWKLTRKTVAFAVSTATAFLVFVPWLITLYHSRSNVAATTNWVDSKLTVVQWTRAWLIGFVRLFFDINNQSGESIFQLLPTALVLSFLVFLFGYAALVLYREAPRAAWLFIFILVGSAMAPLVVVDLLRGGGRLAAANRYLIPGYLGLQLALAFLFAQKLFCERQLLGMIWPAQVLLVFFLGVLSCGISSRAESWWNKDPDGKNREIARIVNGSTKPLVISDGWLGHLFSLSSYLNDDVTLRIEPRCYVCRWDVDQRSFPTVKGEFTDIFYFHPGWEPRSYSNVLELSEAGVLQPLISQGGQVAFWKLTKRAQRIP
jgi:uncharacterized membrane protein